MRKAIIIFFICIYLFLIGVIVWQQYQMLQAKQLLLEIKPVLTYTSCLQDVYLDGEPWIIGNVNPPYNQALLINKTAFLDCRLSLEQVIP